MARGFMYLVAVMDWYSRKVLSLKLSNTLDTDFCLEALEEAIRLYGTPEIFNTDQGAQFTSQAFTDLLKQHQIRISMDGRGRVRTTSLSNGSGGAPSISTCICTVLTTAPPCVPDWSGGSSSTTRNAPTKRLIS